MGTRRTGDGKGPAQWQFTPGSDARRGTGGLHWILKRGFTLDCGKSEHPGVFGTIPHYNSHQPGRLYCNLHEHLFVAPWPLRLLYGSSGIGFLFLEKRLR